MRSLQGLKVREYPEDCIVKMKVGSADIIGAFDIETTLIDWNGQPQSIMYIWQFCIGTPEKRQVYVGRTWEDFKYFMGELEEIYPKFNKWRPMRIYVHNLGYEFQWLRSVGKISDMFAVAKRVPVRFQFNDVFEFRCSWKLTNMSLEKFLEQEKVENKKLNYDYTIKRYPDTLLTDEELAYCVNDVVGLHQAIFSLLSHEGDTFASIPYTSTGYVRRDARKVMQSNPVNRDRMLDARLNEDTYTLCKAAARGGDTHCNYEYAGQILHDIYSHDLASSYPHQMVTKKFPVGAWVRERSPHIIEGAHNLINAVFRGIRARSDKTMPYLPYGKAQRVYGACKDNGRVLYADAMQCVITEIDYKILNDNYTYDEMEILDHYVADTGYLPSEYRNLIKYMFNKKCELKGQDEYFYAKYKNRINALFGMMLTDITRSNVMYDDDEWKESYGKIADLLDEYYNAKNSFLTYQHGLYVTAHARAALRVGLETVGADGIYCDTDSVKHFQSYAKEFEKLNADIIKFNHDVGWDGCTVNGKTYHCGIWEDDAHYSEFISWGAKKYAYRYTDGHLGVTVAGLNKKKGAAALEEAGGLENFDLGHVFNEEEAGRMTAHYNDTVQCKQIVYKGHKCELTSNTALVPTTYTLNISDDYAQLISGDMVWT